MSTPEQPARGVLTARRAPRPLRATVISFVSAAALTLVACGGSTTVVQCEVPPSQPEIGATLEGDWIVADHEDAVVGHMRFTGDDVVAVSGDVTYFGGWSLEGARVNGYTLTMSFAEADDHGVHEVFAEPVTIPVVLVFSSYDELFALQGEGAWSRWTRETP